MSQRYRMPCECGASIPVAAGQAGSRVTCDCGRQANVPMLRELRSFAPVDEPQRVGRSEAPASGVTPARAIFFVSLLTVVIAGLIGGLLTGRRMQLPEGPPQDEIRQMEDHGIESMTPEKMLEVWAELQRRGLTGMPEDPLKELARLHEQLTRRITIAWAIAGLATLPMAAAAWACGRRPTAA